MTCVAPQDSHSIIKWRDGRDFKDHLVPPQPCLGAMISISEGSVPLFQKCLPPQRGSLLLHAALWKLGGSAGTEVLGPGGPFSLQYIRDFEKGNLSVEREI